MLAQPDVAVLFLLLIMVVAIRFGRWPALAASALSVAAYDFCFVPPFYTMTVHDTRHLLTFAMMFAVGLVISTLADRLRRQERAARAREARTAALHALSRGLLGATDARAGARIAARQAVGVFGGETAVLLPRPAGDTADGGFLAEGGYRPADDVLPVARWAFDHARPPPRHGHPSRLARDLLPAAVRHEHARGCSPSGRPPMREGSSRSHADAFLRQTTLALERAVRRGAGGGAARAGGAAQLAPLRRIARPARRWPPSRAPRRSCATTRSTRLAPATRADRNDARRAGAWSG